MPEVARNAMKKTDIGLFGKSGMDLRNRTTPLGSVWITGCDPGPGNLSTQRASLWGSIAESYC